MLFCSFQCPFVKGKSGVGAPRAKPAPAGLSTRQRVAGYFLGISQVRPLLMPSRFDTNV